MEPTSRVRDMGRFFRLPGRWTRRQKGRFYRNSLMLILLIASIPGLITGIVMYGLVVNQMEKEFNQMHQNQIENRARNVDDQLAYLEMTLSHWAFEPRFGNALRTLDFVYFFKETQEIVTTLYVLQGSHPLIQSAQLYLKEPQPIVFNREYNELQDESQIEAYDRYLSMGNHVYWTDWISGQQDTGQSLTSNPSLLHTGSSDALVLVHKIPGESVKPFGALIITLDNSKIASLLKTLTPYDEGLTFLMDAEGNTLITGNTDAGAKDSAFEQQLKDAVALHKDSHSFLFKYEDQTYSVSSGSLSRIDADWTYVSAAPLTSVTSPVKLVSKIIVMASIGSLVLGLLLSWFASRRIYSPVARMVHLLTPGRNEASTDVKLDEFQLLEQHWNELTSDRLTAHRQLQEQLPHLRDSFVLQLVQGHLNAYNEQDLRRRMTNLGFEVEGQQFLLLQMYFIGHVTLRERFGSRDTGLITFAAVNIIEEVAKGYFSQVSVMNFHDLSSAMLIIAPEKDSLKPQALLWGEELMEVIHRTLKMQVTVVVSRPAATLQELPGLFVEMEQAVVYRSVEVGSQILDLDDEQCFSQVEGATYPLGLERDFIQALRLGKRDEAERGMEQFLTEVTRTDSTEFQVQQMMLQLLGSIQHVMLQTGVIPYQLFGGCNMYERLSSIREPAQMMQWMKEKVIRPYMQEIELRSQEPLKQVVERTMQYIDDNYSNDISLEACADLEQMTPYALSKAFKQISGMNFIDYLTQVRMENAKKLLRETSMRINDVASAVGYQHSYFNRIFKKQEGSTPSQYRDQWFTS
ncbi:AraC family transcriptional regulator [Paenibacillus sp. MER 99-2]|uniref:AraC family transcriptional regulator n=1 Tax=Paenibacillus sp. MER 99-2 TaxID=2939572 RepID=UPI00204004AD|nr:AraC family transcriptional regulator [Paenibacillus sp. MER 99-2]MCM3175168.1 AraC family transcriptional regulator [Paenibacillus sp. MER 99-2]